MQFILTGRSQIRVASRRAKNRYREPDALLYQRQPGQNSPAANRISRVFSITRDPGYDLDETVFDLSLRPRACLLVFLPSFLPFRTCKSQELAESSSRRSRNLHTINLDQRAALPAHLRSSRPRLRLVFVFVI